VRHSKCNAIVALLSGQKYVDYCSKLGVTKESFMSLHKDISAAKTLFIFFIREMMQLTERERLNLFKKVFYRSSFQGILKHFMDVVYSSL
jgi:hypothetical protein